MYINDKIFISSEWCTIGDIRLVGGETNMEGRVEVCNCIYPYRWGTICNKQWTSSHTKVVCRSLGYDDTEGILIHSLAICIFIHMDSTM